MSDYMAGEIWIGGKVPAGLIAELCEVISRQGLGLEWGDARFKPSSAADLLEVREEIDGVPLLHLCNDEAPWGQFDELEGFLQQHRISFRRQSDGKWEYDPEIVEYRPGSEPIRLLANHAGAPVVTVEEFGEIDTQWSQAINLIEGGSTARGIRELKNGLAQFRDLLPKAVPPLEPIEIVESSATGKPIRG